MKDHFVITKNVKRFQMVINRINHKLRGVERMALVTGEIGLGKSEAAIQYGAHNGAVILNIWPKMSQHWLLRALVWELGMEPAWRPEKLIEQLKGRLLGKPRTIIFDEIDHLFRDSGSGKVDALETIRKVHDVCHCPIVLIGEEWIDKKISKFPRIDDRIVERTKFEKFDFSDVKQIIGELSDFRFENDAIEKITQDSGGRFRPIMSLIHAAEERAKMNGLRTVGAKDLK